MFRKCECQNSTKPRAEHPPSLLCMAYRPRMCFDLLVDQKLKLRLEPGAQMCDRVQQLWRRI